MNKIEQKVAEAIYIRRITSQTGAMPWGILKSKADDGCTACQQAYHDSICDAQAAIAALDIIIRDKDAPIEVGDLLEDTGGYFSKGLPCVRICEIREVDANGNTGPFYDIEDWDGFESSDGDMIDWICPGDIDNFRIIKRGNSLVMEDV